MMNTKRNLEMAAFIAEYCENNRLDKDFDFMPTLNPTEFSTRDLEFMEKRYTYASGNQMLNLCAIQYELRTRKGIKQH